MLERLFIYKLLLGRMIPTLTTWVGVSTIITCNFTPFIQSEFFDGRRVLSVRLFIPSYCHVIAVLSVQSSCSYKGRRLVWELDSCKRNISAVLAHSALLGLTLDLRVGVFDIFYVSCDWCIAWFNVSCSKKILISQSHLVLVIIGRTAQE